MILVSYPLSVFPLYVACCLALMTSDPLNPLTSRSCCKHVAIGRALSHPSLARLPCIVPPQRPLSAGSKHEDGPRAHQRGPLLRSLSLHTWSDQRLPAFRRRLGLLYLPFPFAHHVSISHLPRGEGGLRAQGERAVRALASDLCGSQVSEVDP